MLEAATDARLSREVRLAVLVSLGWRVLWLPLGVLFALPSLLRHPKILVFACLTYAVIVVWKLASASQLFRKVDALTVWFGLLSSYAAVFVGFLLWLAYVRPPQATDLMLVPTFCIMGATFISVGCVMVIRPEVAARLNELADCKIRLEAQRAGHSPRTWMRIGGVFLASLGTWLLVVATKGILMALGVLPY
jgi:hypothetical protein